MAVTTLVFVTPRRCLLLRLPVVPRLVERVQRGLAASVEQVLRFWGSLVTGRVLRLPIESLFLLAGQGVVADAIPFAS